MIEREVLVKELMVELEDHLDWLNYYFSIEDITKSMKRLQTARVKLIVYDIRQKLEAK